MNLLGVQYSPVLNSFILGHSDPLEPRSSILAVMKQN
jgi:hypothetical protein